MPPGRWHYHLLVASTAPLLGNVPLQTPTPEFDVGPDELVEFWPVLVRAGWFVLGVSVVVLLGWYLIAPAAKRAVRRRNRNNPTLDEAIQRYVRVVVVLVAVAVGATLAGYGGFLGNSAVVVAAVTLAIGVAGQEVIGSLVSGLALVVDPEFNVGNYIQWEDGEGTVRSITLRVTRVQTPNGELVTIPNTVLTDQAITRPFGRGRLRIEERIGVDYEDDLGAAIDTAVTAAGETEGVLAEPDPDAHVDELGDDEVTIAVHYWIEDPTRRNVNVIRSSYARTVKERLESAGITISPASQRQLQGRIGIENETGSLHGRVDDEAS